MSVQVIFGKIQRLTQLWVRFAYTPEAREAEAPLRTNIGGELWAPTAEEHFGRAQAFLGQALHAEAIDELKQFLAMARASAQRGSAKLKLGIAQVRLRQYDPARDTFRTLITDRVAESDEATVWLARVYLRQAMGPKLLELSRSVEKQGLSAEQKGQIHLFAGIWLEDQGHYDEAIASTGWSRRRESRRRNGRRHSWRIGWVRYRTAHYKDAIDVLQQIVDQHDSDFEPQALYWIGLRSPSPYYPHR